MHLIVPIAGKSSRFSTTRPKWMLTHPSGRFMVVEALLGLNLNDFNDIIFISLQSYEDDFHFTKGLFEQLEQLGLKDKTKIIYLNSQTNSQAETVIRGIEELNLDGFCFIKDSDNYFKANISPVNQVCYISLTEVNECIPKNKSYITIDDYNYLTNIVEKSVISPLFSVGGYGFVNAKLLVNTYYEHIQTIKGTSLPYTEVYLSHLIYKLILNGDGFQSNHVDSYIDWGTQEDWVKYTKSFAVLMVDIDGVLVKNSSVYVPPYIGETQPLTRNIELLKKLYHSGKFQIILTTARPESSREVTELQLQQSGLIYDHLIMGLMHCKRILINDYSKSNGYRSCDAINLARDSDELEHLLLGIL